MESQTTYGAINITNVQDSIHAKHMHGVLKAFFQIPSEKFKNRKKFPWKLLLQVFKIILVTIQVVTFATSRTDHVAFYSESLTVFKHIFLKNWADDYELHIQKKDFALYSQKDFFESVNFAVDAYRSVETSTMGTYQFANSDGNSTHPEVVMCTSHSDFPLTWSPRYHKSNSQQVTECFQVERIPDSAVDIAKYMRQQNRKILFDVLNSVTLNFNLTAIQFKYHSKINTPDCYLFEIEITFDNAAHTGKMPVRLRADATPVKCFGEIQDLVQSAIELDFVTLMDVIVLILGFISAFLCVISIYKALKLRRITQKFFISYYNHKLSTEESLGFLDFWYVLIIVNDLLTVSGTIYKVCIGFKLSRDYEMCGLLLGSGCLLVWFGVLRYLRLCNNYSMLLQIMRDCAPHVLRYLVCAFIFYISFVISGWVVLGPYNFHFKDLHTTSETLIALLNGDGVFEVFNVTDITGPVWWFSRLYIYSFVCLFIYVILSVFSAVILEAYDTLKTHREETPSCSAIEQFIEKFDAPEVREDSQTHSEDRLLMDCYTSIEVNETDNETPETKHLMSD